MTSYEQELRAHLLAVKNRIYNSGPPEVKGPVKPAYETKYFVSRQRIDRHADWCLAMRRNKKAKVVTLDLVKRVVCAHFQFKHDHLIAPWRARSIARARQMGMWLSRELASKSLPEIGRAYGNRDHTTVLHAVRKINQLIELEDEDTIDHLRTLTDMIKDETL